MREQRPCKRCGATLRRADVSYCSPECYYATIRDLSHPSVQARRTTPKTGHKVEMVCDGCGIRFWEYPCRRPKPTKYCTRACGLAHQRNKTPNSTDTADRLPTPKPHQPGEWIVLDNGSIHNA